MTDRLTDAEIARLQSMLAGAMPPLGNWQHSSLSELIHAGDAKESSPSFECLANDSLTGISAKIDECCDVEVEQAEDNLYIMLNAANVMPTLLEEVADARASRTQEPEYVLWMHDAYFTGEFGDCGWSDNIDDAYLFARKREAAFLLVMMHGAGDTAVEVREATRGN